MDFGFFALYVASAYGSEFTNPNHDKSYRERKPHFLENIDRCTKWMENETILLSKCFLDFPH